MDDDPRDIALFETICAVAPNEASSRRAIERTRAALTVNVAGQSARPSAGGGRRKSVSANWLTGAAAALLAGSTVGVLWMNKHGASESVGIQEILPANAGASPAPQEDVAREQNGSDGNQPQSGAFHMGPVYLSFLHADVADCATIMIANGGDTPLELGAQVSKAGGKLHVWDWSQGRTSRILPGIEFSGSNAAITPDGTNLLLNWSQLIDLSTGAVTPIDLGGARTEIGDGRYRVLGGMRFSADRTHLAIHVTDLVANPGPTTPPTIERDVVRVVEFPGGKTLSEMPLGEHTTMRVDLSADGKMIALGDIQQQVSLRDTSTGNVQMTFAPALATQLISIAVSPDGQYVAASDREPGDLLIWETEHGNLLHRIGGQEFEKRGSRRHAHGAMRFSPDGRFLADGRAGATFVIDVATGDIEASLTEDATTIQWSADGAQVTLVGSAVVHDHEAGGSPGMDNSYPSVLIWDWRAGAVERR